MLTTTESLFTFLLLIQFFHSIEELSTGFHKVFPVMRLSFRAFLTFEIVFYSFWLFVLFQDELMVRDQLMMGFNLLMFANGVWHVVWAAIVKKYVPGLVTAPAFIVVFVMAYFRMV